MRNVSSGTIYYYAEDMLGSSRRIVQAGQTSPCYDADFYPYGGERTFTDRCGQNYKFTGKERDAETGNDNFGARYYSSSFGPWLSAYWSSVPVPVPYANLSNPQTLNLYAMVSDNPETFADLDGHCGVVVLAGAPEANQPCPNPPQNTPATTGEGKPNPGDGTKPSTTQQAQQPPPATPPPAQGQQQQSKAPLPPGANPAANAAKGLANQERQPLSQPEPPKESPWPTEPAPDVGVPGANSPGVPIGTTPGTTPEVNPETLTTAQKIVYYGAQTLRVVARLVSGTLNFVLMTTKPLPGQPGAPPPES